MKSPSEIVSAIVGGLGGRRSGKSWIVRCPAHDDRTPSLSITERDGRVLVRCHAGCPQADVIVALRSHGLWPKQERHPQSPADRARLAREYAEARRTREEAAYFADAAALMAGWALEELLPDDPERAPHTTLLAGLRFSAEAEYRRWLDRNPTWAAALVQAGRARAKRLQLALARWIIAEVKNAA